MDIVLVQPHMDSDVISCIQNEDVCKYYNKTKETYLIF